MRGVAILTVIFLTLQVKCVSISGRLNNVAESCLQELNMDRNEIEQIWKKRFDYLPEDDGQFNQFEYCYWKRMGFQYENGTINYDRLTGFIKNFPKSRYGNKSGKIGIQIATDAVDGCRNIPRGNSHGQTAIKTYNCIIRLLAEYEDDDEDYNF